MNQNINYWKDRESRKKHARQRVLYNNEHYENSIDTAIKNTVVINGSKDMLKFFEPGPGYIPITRVIDCDVIEVIHKAPAEYGFVGKTAVLNFASFTSPGGKFMDGSSAQEECLCANSTLYNILSDDAIKRKFYLQNRKETNNGLYTDRLLYTPGVLFSNMSVGGSTEFQIVDVITCAAPFAKKARENGIDEETIRTTMKQRINFIFEVASTFGVQNIILGAFGCGVFGNDTEFVAECFADALINNPYAGGITNAIFPILPGYNYDTFCETFNRVFSEYANKDRE